MPASWIRSALRLLALVVMLGPVAISPSAPAEAAVGKVTLTSPANGTALASLALDLRWELPAGATQLTLQVVPANNDGPGVDLAIAPTTRYTLPAPVFGTGPYVMLPGMSYQWRVRASDAAAALGQQDPAWGPWSDWWTFKTPPPSSSQISAGSPADKARVPGLAPARLLWANPSLDIFYYEVQLSRDPFFGENGAFFSVYHNLLHGALLNPPNAWDTPPLDPNTAYFWRVRPRVQGDGTPVPWSKVFTFTTDGGTFGNRIAFASDRGAKGTLNLYSMKADGSDVVRLTNGTHSDTAPAWSPDGTRIAFASNRDNGNTDIYTMRPDGSNVVRLTSDSAIDSDPAWSPDGKSIAFVSFRDGGSAVYVMNADGTGQRRVGSASTGDSRPAWSPDGSRIAFSTRRGADGTAEIFTMAPDGSQLHNLTNSAGADLYPAWSPNGLFIAYASARRGTWEIFVAKSDGSDPLMVATSVDNLYPSWSHDSRHLTFASSRDGNWEVYQLDLLNGQLTRLTNNPNVDTAPAPSPS